MISDSDSIVLNFCMSNTKKEVSSYGCWGGVSEMQLRAKRTAARKSLEKLIYIIKYLAGVGGVAVIVSERATADIVRIPVKSI